MDWHRTAFVLFAVALAIAIVVASVTTLERINVRQLRTTRRPARLASPGRTRRLIVHRASRSRKSVNGSRGVNLGQLTVRDN